jgi:hypothetical protein
MADSSRKVRGGSPQIISALSIMPFNMRPISICPGFGDIRANRSGRTADLVSQRIRFFFRKRLCTFENFALQFTALLVNDQITKTTGMLQPAHFLLLLLINN